MTTRGASVSVVIPCHDYEHYLPLSVGSALAQDEVVEVIVVDDASTDGSADVGDRLAREHPEVIVLRHESNQGPVATFNHGLERVTGEFIVRLDADDMLTPGSVGRAVALARAHPSVGLVYGRPRHFEGEPPAWRAGSPSWTVWPGARWLEDRCRSGFNVITSPEALMRTSVVRRVGGQEPLPYTHDMEMWFRIAAFSDVGRVNGVDQAWHREHSSSLTARLIDSERDLRERRAAFDTLFAGIAGTLPDAQRLHVLARTTLARDALAQACHLYDRGRASEPEVSALVAFARETEPPGAALPEWRAFERRRRIGATAVRRRPWYAAAAIRRRMRREVQRARWARTGVYERSRPAR